MLHRAASSGHSRDDSFGTVGMCCHGPAVFCSFLNHLAGTRGDGRWRKHAQATKSTKNSGSGLSQSFPTLLVTNHTNPPKKTIQWPTRIAGNPFIEPPPGSPCWTRLPAKDAPLDIMVFLKLVPKKLRTQHYTTIFGTLFIARAC